MGNNFACEIVGIGTIRIRMHDVIIKTLKECLTYTRFEENLISLGTLDSLGYKYSGEGVIIQVSKGSLVMMQGNKVDVLYFLQGSTVTGLVDLSSHITRLWHM
jgi:hypothetical protein